jgi:hypothetical protein
MGSPMRIIIALALAMFVSPASEAAAGTEQTKKGPNRFVGLIFKEPKQTEFLKAVLESMKLSYTVTARADGRLVEWASDDPAKDLEIQNRVSQFWFISTQCSGMRLPLPTQPARDSLICQK